MPRFVILRHEHPAGSHYDLMFEAGGALKTWSLPQTPEAGRVITCQSLPDHRLAYLDYEGPISGDRGSVTRWDHGTCEIDRQSPACWVVELHGGELVGQATLTQQAAVDQATWTLCYVPRESR
jgi:hypothetical protein